MRSRLMITSVRVFLGALFLAPALLGGCSQSKMTNMWKDPSYKDGPMKKVLAVAVRKDPMRRRNWEDAFVEELKAHGVSGVASYTAYPTDIPDSSQVSELASKEGCDGVAVSVRLPDTVHDTYVPGYSERVPVTVNGPFLYDYTTYWKEVRVDGYTETDKVRRFRTDLWETQNGARIVWAGTVAIKESVHGSLRDVIRNRIVAELVTAGILPPRTE